MKTTFISKSWVVGLAVLTAVGCKDNTPTPIDPIEENPEGKFIVATTVPGVSDATYFLTAASLDNAKDTISPKGSGLEFTNTFTQYMSYGYRGMIAIKYGQGNAHVGQRFTINSSGNVVTVGNQFELQNGFVTAGIVGDYAYTIMSGFRAADPTTGTMNRVGLNGGDPQFQTFKVNGFAGYEGKNAQLIGIAEGGNNTFYSGLNFSENPEIDNVVVAKINATSLATEAVYSDPRLSVSGASMRSARYSQIGTADNGDVYVFSGNNNGTKDAGALVIKRGASGFDQSYYWNLESASGGYRFRKVWHMIDDIFLVEFYNEFVKDGESPGTLAAAQYAILHMEAKTFAWIQGIPSKANIPSGVSWPYVFGGKAYLGITALDQNPQFYVVDPKTGNATKGLVVKDGSQIQSASFVEK